MAKQPLKNGAPTTPKETDPKVKRHVKVLAIIGAIWLILFLVMVLEREAEVRVALPVATFVFIGYLIYATVSVLWKRL